MDFSKNMVKNIGKNISKNLNGIYSQTIPEHAKKFATDTLKTASKRLIQNSEEATGDVIVIKMLIKLQVFQKIHNKIIQKQLQMNMIKVMPKERYISPKERQKITDNLDINIIVQKWYIKK